MKKQLIVSEQWMQVFKDRGHLRNLKKTGAAHGGRVYQTCNKGFVLVSEALQ